MFNFLKDKLKQAISKFSKDVDEKTEKIEEPKEEISAGEITKESSKKKDAIPKKDSKKENKEKAQKVKEEKGEEPQIIDGEEEVSKEKEEIEVSQKEEKIEEVSQENEDLSEKEEAESESESDENNNNIIDIEEDITQEEGDVSIIKKSKVKAHTESFEEELDEVEKELMTEDEKEEEKEEEELEKSEEKSDSKEEKKGFFSRLFSKKEEKEDKKLEIKSVQEKQKEVIAGYPEKIRQEKKEIREEIKKDQKEDKTQVPAQKIPVIIEEKREKVVEKKKEQPQIKKEPIKHVDIDKTQSSGFFRKIKEAVTKKSLSEKEFDDIFWDLELALLENNVALEVIEKIKLDLKKELVESKVLRGSVDEIISETLRNSISELFITQDIDLIKNIKSKKPYVIAFIGVNGSGKTTTIAKMANLFLKNNLKCVIAASDTFRAAAIQQLEEHANKLGVKLIKHDYGSDPAAVAFDAIKYAQSKGIDVVMIDTAGRLHSNTNLMDELRKVIRVSNPDFKIFIGESITGNDCVEQASQFNDAVGIDGIILSKADIDDKGGAAVSVSYVTKKPILYLGVGQGYDDIKEFDKELILSNLGL